MLLLMVGESGFPDVGTNRLILPFIPGNRIKLKILSTLSFTRIEPCICLSFCLSFVVQYLFLT